ncbi:MAG: GAF domain-containing SpoIIE family protein phosphatase [Cytophagaceae bacterium]
MTQKLPSNGNSLENKLHLKHLELNSLLEITEAINANLPEESLYKIFHFTLIANLNIKKLALFVLDTDWECKASYGAASSVKSKVLCDDILELKEISRVEGKIKEFEEFDLVIPIAHKSRMLAYVLVGGMKDYEGQTDIPFIQTFANIILVAIENKRLARKQLEQEAFRKEMEIARDVQLHLFPSKLPDSAELKMHASYLPALMVGGDYYDYVRLDKDHFLVCIADVSGKGMSAALLMSNFQASLRTLARQTQDLKEIVKELNINIKSSAKGERFITFFGAIINSSRKTLRYINAGHNPPVLLFNTGEMHVLEKGTTVLGAFDDLPFIEEEEITITEDTMLFAYTDGLTETSNEQDEEFGLDNIMNFVKNNYKADLKKMHEALFAELNGFKGSRAYPDDITFLSCLIS